MVNFPVEKPRLVATEGLVRSIKECVGVGWYDCGMNRRKKEKQVEALGPPWSKTMEVYKQARDKQLEVVNASDETTAIKTAWRKYHQKHYDKLIRLIVKLGKQRKQSAKPAALSFAKNASVPKTVIF